ncbi:MAG: hypothetical protein R2708_27030 [Vicinamibacterales bacterium]
MLLIAVATIAAPGGPIRVAAGRADEHDGVADPPWWSTNEARSPSPSKATPARPAGDHRRLQGVHRGRAAALIDVAPVGRVADHLDVEPERREQGRCDGGGGAVGAVDDDAGAGQRTGVVEDLAQVGDVVGRQLGIRGRCDGPVRHLPRLVADDLLDLPFLRFRELLAGAREHLDAVVVERVVGGRDDNPEVEGFAAGEIGDGRRRHHAEADDGAVPGGHTAGQRRFQGRS